MSLTQIQKLQLNKQVDRILHIPGNQPVDSKQFEMAFVIDCSSDLEYIETTTKDIVSALKAHDKIFQNVRSNVVYWRSQDADKALETQTIPMSFIQMGKAFVDFEKTKVDKFPRFDDLCAYLKLYHARSKCIILITQGNYEIEDKNTVKENLSPFLKQKLVIVMPDKMVTGMSIFMEMLS